MSLLDVINLSSEHGIMQATCNNHCARLAQDRFDWIGWHDDMGGNGVNMVNGDALPGLDE
jgi:hypothetical protein